jgi:hypothetical protein
MAFKFSTAVRNAAIDAVETTIGTAPTLTIRTGSEPATANDAATGTVLVTMTLPSDWMTAASSGSKSLSGTWQDASADATGTAGYFRITGSGGVIQGNVTATGGGGDMTIDNVSIAAGQQVTVTSFTLTAGGA